MGKFLKIKALILLSVFSLITLQNSVPHIHHSHDGPDVIVLSASEQHEPRNHFEEKNASAHELTFLHQLVENHSHNSHAHEVVQLNSTDSRQINISVFHLDNLTTVLHWPEKLDYQIYTFYKNGKVFSPHSSGFTLRGPPIYQFS